MRVQVAQSDTNPLRMLRRAGEVADGHDQVAVLPHLADVPGSQPGQRQGVPPSGVDRAGIDG